jgi:hypothetical protein
MGSYDSFSSDFKSVILRPFDGTNYLSWRSQMRTLFEIKGVKDIMDGTTERPPTTDPTYSSFRSRELVATVILQQTIVQSIWDQYVMDVPPVEAWKVLSVQYGGESESQILRNFSSLITLRQEEGESVRDYAARIKNLRDQLAGTYAKLDDSLYGLLFLTFAHPKFHTAVVFLSQKKITLADAVAGLANEEIRISTSTPAGAIPIIGSPSHNALNVNQQRT